MACLPNAVFQYQPVPESAERPGQFDSTYSFEYGSHQRTWRKGLWLGVAGLIAADVLYHVCKVGLVKRPLFTNPWYGNAAFDAEDRAAFNAFVEGPVTSRYPSQPIEEGTDISLLYLR